MDKTEFKRLKELALDKAFEADLEVKKLISDICVELEQFDDTKSKCNYLIDQKKYFADELVKDKISQLESPNNNSESITTQFIEYIIRQIDKLYKIYLDLKGFESELNLEVKKEKVKWKASPALFGFIFNELAFKGFIEQPLKNGEVNSTGYSRILKSIFDIDSTEGTLKKEFNPNSNSLSETKKVKFTIPELYDLK
jgi:hypothetical protein